MRLEVINICAVEIYHLFLAYTAVPRSVILPVAMLAESELLRGAKPPAE